MGQRTISPLVHLVEHPEVNHASPQFAGTPPAIDENPAAGTANPLRVLVKQGLTNDVWTTAPSSADQLAAIRAQQIIEDTLPLSPEHASDRYVNNVQLVSELVNAGKYSGDVVWRNTCEWLLGRRVPLYVLAPIDDKAPQAQAQKKPENSNLRMYFGLDAPVRFDQPPVPIKVRPYGEMIKKERDNPGTYDAAYRRILVIDPVAHRAELQQTLIRVVQTIVAPRESESLEVQFREELTQRWIRGDHAGNAETETYSPPTILKTYDPTSTSDPNNPDHDIRRLGFYSLRQNQIIDDILKSTPRMREAWNDRKFQNAALRVRGPQSINPFNSIRLYDLGQLIIVNPPELLTKVKARMESPERLDAFDKSTIAAQAELWCKFLRGLDHLTDDEKNGIAAILHLPQVVVQPHIY